MLQFAQPQSRSHVALRGVLAAVLVIVLIVWPEITLGTVIALFAVYCFVDAAVSTARLFMPGRSGGDRLLLGLRALVGVGAAVVAIAYPGATVSVMTAVIGIYAVVVGVVELAGSGRLSRLGFRGTGWLAVSGSLAILTGVLLIVWPSIGAVTLAIVLAVYLTAYGLLLLISAAVRPSDETVGIKGATS